MTDFEVNNTGTLRKLNLEDMTLRVALAYIDALGDATADPEDQDERRIVLAELRKELGSEYQ